MIRPSRHALVVAVVAVVVIGLAFTVWPTPWRYASSCGQLVRIHRVTGEPDVLLDDGWIHLQRDNPFDKVLRMGESERLGYYVRTTLVCPPPHVAGVQAAPRSP